MKGVLFYTKMGQAYNNMSQAEKDAFDQNLKAFAAGTDPAITNGLVVSGGASITGQTTIVSGGLNINAGGATLTGQTTIVSGGLNVNAGGATIVGQTAISSGGFIVGAGGATITGQTQVVGPTSASGLIVTSNANVSGATLAPLQLVASTASQALISIQGVFISTASINVAASATAFVIPVYHASQGIFGFITVSKGVI